MTVSVTADNVLYQCLVAYGSGTRALLSSGEAVEELVSFFRPKFDRALQNDPERFTDSDEDHRNERIFVLRCAEMIGRLAAHKAAGRCDVSISCVDVKEARSAVINRYSKNPGDWCN